MTSGNSIGISTMKPCCRALISSRHSLIFGISRNIILINDSSTLPYHYRSNCKLRYYRNDRCTSKILRNKCKNESNRIGFCDSGSNWGYPRVCDHVYHPLIILFRHKIHPHLLSLESVVLSGNRKL